MKFKGWEKKTELLPDAREVRLLYPLIISASRSTDIPAFYSRWFLERLHAGYVKWINPFNGRPSYVSLRKTRVVVFWSKNPRPLIGLLPEIDRRGMAYYFQFTLNDYENEDLEPNLPPLQDRIETFREISRFRRAGEKK